ncbi:carboxypeptidase regulatory-like domain-containing protein [Stenotrophomonas terrae]|uniref:carboxypeptidase regulatory-like domain-containing protein n=1 Tax=Stenotrophomonas terrae TaxID=405446 RepID=UPI00320AF796
MMEWLPLALIVLAVALASLRFALPPRPPAVRLATLLLLQLAAGILLYFTLQPPSRPGHAGTLVVASAGANAAELAAVPAAAYVRLPEAPALAAATAVPDLASALRQHPGTRELVVIGQGLPARDRDIALPALRFLPNAAPRGLVELRPPPLLAPGAAFSVHSRVQGMPGARVELLDPAGHRADIAEPDSSGRVTLHASAREPGDVSFVLRVLDAGGKVMDQLPVPVRTRASSAPTIRVLAGAPGPELKYLQRWGTDIGARMQTSMLIGGGLQLGDAPAALDAASLARLDLLLLDERRLASLSSAQRAAITDALRAGLGVLVRTGGALDGNARRALRDWGLDTRGGDQTKPVTLRSATDAEQNKTALTVERFNLEFNGTDVVPLVRAADGTPIGGWRALGLGRVGVLPVTDSYALVLAGHADAHAELWNAALASVARPLAGAPKLQLPAWAWSGERIGLCGLAAPVHMLAADGSRTALLPDPSADNCVAAWPQKAGWHRIEAGDQHDSILLLDPAKAIALHAQQMHDATFAMRGSAAPSTPLPVPGPRWPWLLGFVLVASLLWWLERRRPSSVATQG